MERKTVGALLREARQRALLTLEALAQTSGVSVRAISDLERGRSAPRQSTLSELMDALDIDEDERRALLDAARRGGRSTAPRVPGQLPPDLRVFQGRQSVMARMEHLTAEAGERPAHVLITAVGGMAGVGKTALAVHWAHQVADRYPDGQLYVNLRGFDPSAAPAAPGEVLAGFLNALGVPGRRIPDGTDARAALFREETDGRRLIVVLDNARDSRQVRPLLTRSPGCLTVVTSRNHLTGLATTDGAHLIDLDLWTYDEALAALAARIGPDRVAAEPGPAAELVELCGRLPLAVAVLAAHLAAEPRLPLRVTVREVTEARSRLDMLSTDDPRTDVRAVFSWSYRALDPAAARFFRHLAVIPGPVLSAEVAASASGVPMPRARGALRTLVSAGLLSRDAEGRYVLHDLVREHASDLLDQGPDDRPAAESRLFDYLRHNARTAARTLNPHRVGSDGSDSGPPVPGALLLTFGSREDALAWFQQEERTVMAVPDTAGDPRLLRLRRDLAHDCVPYFSARGQWADEIAVQRRGLDAALLLDDPVGAGTAASDLARALALAGTEHADEVEELIRLAERQHPRIPPVRRAHTLRATGWIRYHQGRHAEAVDLNREALEIYRTVPEPNLVARQLNAIGYNLALMGRYREAVASCRQALPILQEQGNRFSEAATWDSIGYALYHLGELREAVDHYRTSLRLYDDAPDAFNQAEVLDHLAQAHAGLAEPEAAHDAWSRAAELLDTIAHPRAAELRARARDVVPPT
ncbi:ATP-binding protein [Streptomyces sp. CRN 30]|uniref:ATP-binding protein n=1 Tax=Streptomyces sp. CRN 30 TaxID=3075613 RepID=UPI002A7F0885|nr:tetratricopeptide repeat protein [Streptomyces sp. CRN 30]